METVTKYLSLLAICLILVHHQSVAHENRGKDLINEVCQKTTTKDLCVGVLSSDPILSPRANLQDLAMISLREAAANASSILNDAKSMIDNPDLDPAIQQGLADCKETLLDAADQLEDTIASILANSRYDAHLWLQAALAAIDSCDDSIPGDDDILSRRSRSFRQLCNIAVAINDAMRAKEA
ncbi:pectinesterase inhibitor-like [Gastrolobium bilobum]|uniref:pectinesterase inhibitor-like n=1 Tax=Gastrolobium bilobum TaxID=150636 RepID=UPI002AB2E4E3|nr:pectinesterase inhibitor-like [Gastrolobium bilobum]